ncbi:MAG TPA: hypothetical protein VFE35_00875 [Candidatus Cybelea sp.]|nr:hypothetical protein [Candidatus Cybelea sp.]
MRVPALVVAFCLCCTAAAPAASPSTDPVTFQECHLTPDPGALVPHFDVTFRNATAAPIASVRVALMAAQDLITTVDDRETLTPGVSVVRRFQLDTAAFPIRHPWCAAAVVHYADGTTWTNPVLGPNAEAHVAQTPGSRIRIEQCVTTERDYKRAEFGLLALKFTNDAAVAASEVTFSLVAGGVRRMRIVRPGTFSTGVSIDDQYTADANIFPLQDVHPMCRVDSVRFADGTIWTNPASPAEPYGTRQTPGSRIDVLRCTPKASHPERGEPPINSMVLGFRNTAQVTAAEVDFVIHVKGAQIASSRFKGTFATGATVENTVVLDGFPLGTLLAECAVVRVVYTDGTTWAPPSSAPR